MSKPVYMRSPSGEVFTTERPEYHKDCEQLTRTEGEKARREYCAAELRKLLKPGQKVYCVLRRVSGSGMSRNISLFIVTPASKGQPAGLRNIDVLTADAIGYSLASKGEGVRVDGCGMDMGFALVYSLGATVWPKGTPKPHGRRNGEPDKAGGYALKHEWI